MSPPIITRVATIEPPARGKDVDDPMEAQVCEICSCEIPADHIAEGRAQLLAPTKARCERCCKRSHSAQSKNLPVMPQTRSAGASPTRMIKVPSAIPGARAAAAPSQPPPRALQARPASVGARPVAGVSPLKTISKVPAPAGLPQTLSKSSSVALPSVTVRPASGITSVPASGGSHPGSSTRITGIVSVPRPASSRRNVPASGIQPAPSVSGRQAKHYFCQVCGLPLQPEDVNSGAAEIRDGNVYCRGCLTKEKAAKKQSSNGLIPAVVIVVLGAATAIAFPGAAFIALALGSLCIAALALCMLDWAWTVRLSAALLCVLVAGASIYQISQLREASTAAQTTGDLAQFEKQMAEDLQNNQIRDALAELQKLKIAASTPQGGFTSPAAEESVTRARTLINGWLEKKYPDSNAIGRQLVLAFMDAFPPAAGSNTERFTKINANGAELTVALLAPDDTEIVAPGDGPETERRYSNSYQDAWQLADYVFRQMGAISELHEEVQTPSGTVRDIRINRQQYEFLKRATVPALVLSKPNWEAQLQTNGHLGANVR